MILKIGLYVLITVSLCSAVQYSNVTSHKKITVIGKALNSKDAAIVKTDKGFYLLDGLNAWNEKYYGKKVKVTGRLLVKTYKQRSTYPGEFQERVGTVQIIKEPKWELVH